MQPRFHRPESIHHLPTPVKFLGGVGLFALATGTMGLVISSCQSDQPPQQPEFSIFVGQEGNGFYTSTPASPPQSQRGLPSAVSNIVFKYQSDGVSPNNGTIIVADTASSRATSVDLYCKAGNLTVRDIYTPSESLLKSTRGYTVEKRYLPQDMCAVPFKETFGKNPQKYGTAVVKGVVAQNNAAKPGEKSEYLGEHLQQLVR